MLNEYKQIERLFRLKPALTFSNDINVAKVNRINTDGMTGKELEEFYHKIVQFLKTIPSGKYKQITIGRRGFLHYPKTKNRLKNEFLLKMQDYTNKVWNIRQRSSYILFQNDIDKQVFYGNAEGLKGLITESDISEFKSDIAHIFQGNEKYPFGKPLTKWKYGFKIGDKYAIGLINYNVSDRIVMFGLDFLNLIQTDFLSILHFESMDKLTAEHTIANAITIAEKTKMPSQVIEELIELKNQNFAKGVPLVKFFHIIYLFADSPEEAIKTAYQVKALAPYNYEFEGNIEFEAIFSLTDFNFLKGKDMSGIVRKSTIDYFAGMLYSTGRFNGSDKGLFIPMLNEIAEPSYVPIDLSLFNVATQGQMGSGKSVSIQYLSTMFDSVVFIEKIQSDVGSYAVYCNYFNGEHIPVSLEVPVGINPLGKAYSYFTLDIFDLASSLGIPEPHKYFDENERQAISFTLDDYYFSNIKTSLTSQEIADALNNEPRAVRLVRFLQAKPEFVWQVKITTNSVKKVFINTVLAFMYKGEDEDIKEFGEVKSKIEEIVDRFYTEKYRENPAKEVLLSELYDFIREKEPDSRIKERLLTRLYTFTRDGKFGHLFDKPTNIRQDIDHIFFEVRFSERDVIPIVIITIMDYINTVFGSVRYREKSKLVVVDEGWFFMAIPMARNFIDEAFRTYRKRGIGIAFATQQPSDFNGMTNYFPYVWILYLEDPEDAVRTYKLTERDYKLLKTIDKPKAYNYRYAKAFIKFKNQMGKDEKGLFILPSYPEFRWIAETDPQFKLERERAILETGDLRKAIERLSFGGKK